MSDNKKNLGPELMRTIFKTALNFNNNIRSVKKSKTQKTKNTAGFYILNLLLLKSRISKSEILDKRIFSPTTISNAIENLLSDSFITYDIVDNDTKKRVKKYRLTISGQKYIEEFIAKALNGSEERLE
jgi:DNA-binding MarR family transcriptional regulator